MGGIRNALKRIEDYRNNYPRSSLDLSGLGLKTLPDELFCLDDLQYLDISHNQISRLSTMIRNLKYLSYLDISNNRIKEIPKEITELHELKVINTKSNPIKSPPLEIISRGIDSIRNYFFFVNDEDIEKVFEAKLIIVGQGNVGKTSLLKKIINERTLIENESTTEGIDILPWTVNLNENKKFQINFWDFGGQEIYHSTHQFFLTKRSLYLFVWEARNDGDIFEFDYWLNVIKLLSDNSPVIIIQNKVDERKKNNLNQEVLINNFDNIYNGLTFSNSISS